MRSLPSLCHRGIVWRRLARFPMLCSLRAHWRHSEHFNDFENPTFAPLRGMSLPFVCCAHTLTSLAYFAVLKTWVLLV